MARMRHLILLTLALATTGCGYTPPPRTDTASAAFKADLEVCDSSVPDAVGKQAAKRAYTWAASAVTRWSRIEDGMNACMADKGWGRVRACSETELRQGNRAGGLVVTAAGIRCSDPGKAS